MIEWIEEFPDWKCVDELQDNRILVRLQRVGEEGMIIPGLDNTFVIPAILRMNWSNDDYSFNFSDAGIRDGYDDVRLEFLFDKECTSEEKDMYIGLVTTYEGKPEYYKKDYKMYASSPETNFIITGWISMKEIL